jgi:hypothetical protein
MDREQLTALRDVLDLILELPDNVRTQLVAWLTPETAKPNGVDHHPPPIAEPSPVTLVQMDHPKAGEPEKTERAVVHLGRPTPYAGKVRLGRPATSAKASAKKAEQRLLAAMQGGAASISALAQSARANRSSTRERLQELAARGAVTKDAEGRWLLVAELDSSIQAQAIDYARGPLPDPTQPPAATS